MPYDPVIFYHQQHLSQKESNYLANCLFIFNAGSFLAFPYLLTDSKEMP
jgi:hypothetical protein